eukprot:jgi/Bigna1/140938/aug1.59_g15646
MGSLKAWLFLAFTLTLPITAEYVGRKDAVNHHDRSHDIRGDIELDDDDALVDNFDTSLQGKGHGHNPHNHTPHFHAPPRPTSRPTDPPTPAPTQYPSTSPTRVPTAYPTPGTIPSDQILGENEELVVQRGLNRGSIKYQFRLSFELKLTGLRGPDYTNIMHMTARDSQLESRPAVWTYPNSTQLHIRMSTEQDPGGGCDPPQEIPLNQWTNVSILLIGRGAVLVVRYDDKIVCTNDLIGDAIPSEETVRVYFSDPWFDPASAEVRSFEYQEYVPTPDPTVTPTTSEPSISPMTRAPLLGTHSPETLNPTVRTNSPFFTARTISPTTVHHRREILTFGGDEIELSRRWSCLSLSLKLDAYPVQSIRNNLGIKIKWLLELGSTGVVISQPGLCGNDDTGVFLDVVIYRLPSTNAEMVITKIEDFEHGDGVQGGRNITTLFTGESWFEGQAEILTLGTEDDLDVDDPVSGSATTSVAVIVVSVVCGLVAIAGFAVAGLYIWRKRQLALLNSAAEDIGEGDINLDHNQPYHDRNLKDLLELDDASSIATGMTMPSDIGSAVEGRRSQEIG